MELKGRVERHGRISNRNVSSGLSAVTFMTEAHSLQWSTQLTLSSPGVWREFSPSAAACPEPGPSRTVVFCCCQHLCVLNTGIMATQGQWGMDFRQIVTVLSNCLLLASWWHTTGAIQQLPNSSRSSKSVSHKHDHTLLHTNVQEKTVSNFLRLNKIFLFHFWVLFMLVCVYTLILMAKRRQSEKNTLSVLRNIEFLKYIKKIIWIPQNFGEFWGSWGNFVVFNSMLGAFTSLYWAQLKLWTALTRKRFLKKDRDRSRPRPASCFTEWCVWLLFEAPFERETVMVCAGVYKPLNLSALRFDLRS